jgi:hypothetical protein
MTNFCCDTVNGNDAWPGTPAQPKKTFAAVAALVTNPAADKAIFKASPAPTMVGGNAMATWNDLAKSIAVTWQTQQLADIDKCEVAWTAGAVGSSGTPPLDSATGKRVASVNGSPRLNMTGATGLVGYRSLGANFDFSAYQQVSFWIRTNANQTSGSSRMSLRLCSDVAGAVTVNTIPIPALVAGRWTLVTVDTGGNLGNSIQSVALYADQTNSAATIWLDNIIACKNAANALTLTSLISKGTAGETYYGIASIENITGAGCTIYIDNQTETLRNTGRGYAAQTPGLNETLALWKREPITLTQAGLSLSASAFFTTAHGTVAAPIRFEFGYENLNDPAPTGETWFDGQNGFANLFTVSHRYNHVSGLGAVRFSNGLVLNNVRGNVLQVVGINNSNAGVSVQNSTDFSLTAGALNNNGSAGYASAGTGFGRILIRAGQANGNTIYGFALSSFEDVVPLTGKRMPVRLNGGTPISFQGHSCVVRDADFSSNSNLSNQAAAPSIGPSTDGLNYVIDCTLSNSGAVPNFLNTSFRHLNSLIAAKNVNRVAGDDRIYTDDAVISSDTTTTRTAGRSWKCNFQGTTRDASYPVRFPLTRLFCRAARAVTVKASMRRDNINAVGQLFVRGNSIAGVAADLSASASGAINQWETVTLTFTPTEDGFVDVWWGSYSSVINANVWVDDVTISGAVTTRESNTLDIGFFGAPFAAGVNGSTTTYLSLAWNDVQLAETIRATLPLGEAPDAAPTATLYKNGVIVPGATINIASAGGNDYDITTQIAAGWAAGDSYKLKASWTIAGDVYSQMIAQGNVRAVPNTIAPDNATINAIHADYARRGDLPTDYQQRNVAVTLPADAATSENVQDVLDALEVLKGAGWTDETLKAIFEAQSTLQQSATEMETDLEAIKIKTLTFGSGPAVVYSPVISVGFIELVDGSDYYQSEGRAVVVPMASGNIMAIRDQIAQLQFVVDDDDAFLISNVDYENTDDGIVAIVELSGAQVSSIGMGDHTFYFRAILNNGRKNHLTKGALEVLSGGE